MTDPVASVVVTPRRKLWHEYGRYAANVDCGPKMQSEQESTFTVVVPLNNTVIFDAPNARPDITEVEFRAQSSDACPWAAMTS